MLHSGLIILQHLRRSLPSKRTHGEVVVIPVVIYLQLSAEILKGIKGMDGIKPLIVLPVAAFHLPIVSRCVRPYQLVEDAMVL